MGDGMEPVTFAGDGGDEEFVVLAETTFGGEDYLLVCDGDVEDEETTAYILHALGEKDGERIYEDVVDEKLLAVLPGIFEELMEDISLR